MGRLVYDYDDEDEVGVLREIRDWLSEKIADFLYPSLKRLLWERQQWAQYHDEMERRWEKAENGREKALATLVFIAQDYPTDPVNYALIALVRDHGITLDKIEGKRDV